MKLHEIIKNNTICISTHYRDNKMEAVLPNDKFIDCQYIRQWLHIDGKNYSVVCWCKYIDYTENDINFNGVSWFFSIEVNFDAYINFSKTETKGINDYFNYNPTDSEWKKWLFDELRAAKFPVNIIDAMLQQESGNGCSYKKAKQIIESTNRVKFAEPNMIINGTIVIMDVLMDEESIRPVYLTSSSNQPKTFLDKFLLTYKSMELPLLRKHDFYHNFNYFYNYEELRYYALIDWLNKNTNGNVWIYGNSGKWGNLIFENKNDAMMFKMTCG